MKSKILILLTATLLSAASSFAQSGETGPLIWELNDGTLTISGNGAMPDYGCIFVPWYDYREFIIHVVIENGVTHIGNIAFSYCYALVSISIPNSVLTIGHQVFSDCEALLSVFISNKVTGIGSHVFSGCRSLTAINVDGGNAHYSSADGVLFDKEKNILICCPGAKTGDYVIPNSVINIEEWAFLGCAHLTSVSIPGSVKNIGDKAFYYCEELTSVAMSEGVENIGNEAFSYCKNLLSINIPNGVITIGNDAFLNCSTLIAIDIPNSVTSIGNYAFYGCSALAAITLSNNMPTINEGTFFHCRALTDIHLPDNLESIEYGAFSGCSSLASIVLPDGVTTIEDYAFFSCEKLASVTNLNFTPIDISTKVFNGVDITNCTLKVPTDAISDYKNAAVWKNFNIISYNEHTVTISVNNDEYGYATGDGLYEENATVTVTATAYDGYQFVNWTKNGTEVSTNNPYSFTVTEDVELIANFEEGVGIEPIAISAGSMFVYPNPTSGELRIENGELRIDNVEIFDVMGNLTPVPSPIWRGVSEGRGEVNISHLPPGIYFIRITTENGVITKKVIKF